MYRIMLDKDECSMNQDQCDRETTVCVNKVPHIDGQKYVCECKEGFDRVDNLNCIGE